MKKTEAVEFVGKELSHLRPELRKRIQKVLTRQNQKTWDDTYCIIICKGKTLWQSVRLINPFFCSSKPVDSPWEEIPDSETIRQAIKNLTKV